MGGQQAAPADRRAQQPGRGDPGQLRAVDPVLPGRRDGGPPWVTRLPFPVQVVERVETIDWIGREPAGHPVRLPPRLLRRPRARVPRLRHGRAVGHRGVPRRHRRSPTATSSNWDQQSWSPPVLTRTWFHTGAFTEAAAVTRQYPSEYWTEPALRAPGRAADAAAMRPPDTVLPGRPGPLRGPGGLPRAQGPRAADRGLRRRRRPPAAANPYTRHRAELHHQLPAAHRAPNLHAVFFVHPRETVSFDYERGRDDPRVSHEIILEADDYGNVERSVSVGLSPPRRVPAARTDAVRGDPGDAGLRPGAAARPRDRARLHQRRSTTWPPGPTPTARRCWRRPTRPRSPASPPRSREPGSPACSPSTRSTGPGRPLWHRSATTSPTRQIPASDVDGTGTPAQAPTRRIVASQRVVYRSDDLTALLPAWPAAAPGAARPVLPGRADARPAVRDLRRRSCPPRP